MDPSYQVRLYGDLHCIGHIQPIGTSQCGWPPLEQFLPELPSLSLHSEEVNDGVFFGDRRSASVIVVDARGGTQNEPKLVTMPFTIPRRKGRFLQLLWGSWNTEKGVLFITWLMYSYLSYSFYRAISGPSIIVPFFSCMPRPTLFSDPSPSQRVYS